MIQPEIKIIQEKLLVGKKLPMSFSQYTVSDLWRSFIPEKNKIHNRKNNEWISLAVYPADFFKRINPSENFIKWAAAEVSSIEKIPAGMEKLVLEKGLYAVFHYKGLNTDNSIYQYIFKTWLPTSEYDLDTRPHFEVLGEKYKNNDPESEEDIFIPVKKK